MEKPAWVENDIKYQRAIANAKDSKDEAELKELYVSYGGKLLGGQPVEVKEEVKEEVVEPEPVIESPIPVEEVKVEETPIEEVPVEEAPAVE